MRPKGAQNVAFTFIYFRLRALLMWVYNERSWWRISRLNTYSPRSVAVYLLIVFKLYFYFYSETTFSMFVNVAKSGYVSHLDWWYSNSIMYCESIMLWNIFSSSITQSSRWPWNWLPNGKHRTVVMATTENAPRGYADPRTNELSSWNQTRERPEVSFRDELHVFLKTLTFMVTLF